jgi:hypothetical protein
MIRLNVARFVPLTGTEAARWEATLGSQDVTGPAAVAAIRPTTPIMLGGAALRAGPI